MEAIVEKILIENARFLKGAPIARYVKKISFVIVKSFHTIQCTYCLISKTGKATFW